MVQKMRLFLQTCNYLEWATFIQTAYLSGSYKGNVRCPRYLWFLKINSLGGYFLV
jgi:hypothetical protein